jgi:hypothetical protein
VPPPTDIVGWLIDAGPYAVTLIVLVWLWLERKERLASQKAERELLRESREERGQTVKAMAEFGEATRNRLKS